MYCVADYPYLVIGELDGELFALNGIARQWANNENLHAYRNGKWVAIYDRGVNPLELKNTDADGRVSLGNRLCPSPSRNILDDASERIREGEERLHKLGPKFGLPR
jgi:hypothetical protein